MSIQKVKIANEHGQEIKGIKATNGNIEKIVFTVDTVTKHIECKLPSVDLEYDKENESYTFIFDNDLEQQYKLDFILDCSLNRWLGI